MNQRDYFGDDAALLLNAASGGAVIPHPRWFRVFQLFLTRCGNTFVCGIFSNKHPRMNVRNLFLPSL